MTSPQYKIISLFCVCVGLFGGLGGGGDLDFHLRHIPMVVSCVEF